MSCYHPLKAFAVGTHSSGKVKYKICAYDVDHVECDAHGVWSAVSTPLRSARAVRVVREFVEIACGKCLDCRMRRSRDWANRCMMELQYHDSAYFVTLTYNDKHLPIEYHTDGATGEALPVATLRKSDLQNWIKRLRRRYPNDNIRYYAGAEYGRNTMRPHYHVIVFGLHLDDLEPVSVQRGYTYYKSLSLEKTWSVYDPDTQSFDPIGYVTVGAVTWQSCAYTARYILDKQTADNGDYYTEHGILPPYQCMSLKPAIGHQYYVDHGDEIYRYDQLYLTTPEGGMQSKPPRYFDNLYAADNPDDMQDVKATRLQAAMLRRETMLAQTTLSYTELLRAMERTKQRSFNKLLRTLD